MIARLRVLRAALELGRFTIAELVRFSDVTEQTVRTVLRRDGAFFREVEKIETGKRGGQPGIWEVRAQARDELRALVASPDESVRRAPVELRVAHDTLLRRFVAEPDPAAREDLIRFAEGSFALGIADLHEDDFVRAHRASFELELELCKAERAGTLTPAGYLPFRARANEIVEELSLAGDAEHALALAQRALSIAVVQRRPSALDRWAADTERDIGPRPTEGSSEPVL